MRKPTTLETRVRTLKSKGIKPGSSPRTEKSSKAAFMRLIRGLEEVGTIDPQKRIQLEGIIANFYGKKRRA
jgi:hypothetical protein